MGRRTRILLLNLTRYTGNPFYAELLRDIAHSLPQYMSHPEQMINPDHAGWMSERVNTSDWKEGIGQISYHSTWPEVALALTYTEIPGIYIHPATAQLIAFDNIKARIIQADNKAVSVKFENPTNQKASVKVFVDKQSDRNNIVDAFSELIIVELEAQETKVVRLK